MADGTPVDLLDTLASAAVEADLDDAITMEALVEALQAARLGHALVGPLKDEVAEISGQLQAADLAAGALSRLNQLLSECQTATAMAQGTSAPVLAGAASASRDGETVELIGEFLEESTEGLAHADAILLGIERGEANSEKVNALFRVYHTIKGVAGFLELSQVVSLAHTTETLLNQVREGRRTLVGEAFDATFESTSRLRHLLEALRRAVASHADLELDGAVPALVTRLQVIIDEVSEEGGAPVAPASSGQAGPANPSGTPLQVPLQARAPVAPGAGTGAGVPPSSTPTASQTSTAPVAGGAAPVTSGTGGPRAQLRETVKVDLERVDSMVEMIGELIIVESMVMNAPEIATLTSLKVRNYLNQLSKISRDLQNVAMRMRMVPVRGAFQKMARLVRDLGRKSGKNIVLEQSGEDTEMDRSMVERIEDPLVHMVRNSIDHGIETTADRKASGKAARAVIRLSAYHEGGSIVVEVSDDGLGLQRDKIVAKARAKGLVEEGHDIGEQEIYNLIFMPGFSTAAQVSEISGRGVGMDVVKRNVEAMRGRVSVTSRPGQGTTFKMVLPLTLAIIDGMLVACGTERYILPSLSIVESLRPTDQMISLAAGRGEVINVRGEILPLLRLQRLLNMAGPERPPSDCHVVVLEGLGRKIGVVVDDVLTQQQVVIKPLGHGIGDTNHLSGAAILSDGRVGLILNVDRLSSLAAQGRRSAVGA